tara:strand:+ start:4403 stop:4594 length:192 start_codon:yes stop_codon:yes gene_type:complete
MERCQSFWHKKIESNLEALPQMSNPKPRDDEKRDQYDRLNDGIRDNLYPDDDKDDKNEKKDKK